MSIKKISILTMLSLLSIPTAFYAHKQLGDTVSGSTIQRGAVMDLVKNVPKDMADTSKLANANLAIAIFDGHGQNFSDYDTLIHKLKSASSPKAKKEAVAAISGLVDVLWHLYAQAPDADEQQQMYNEIVKLIDIASKYDRIKGITMAASAYAWHNPKKTVAGVVTGGTALGLSAYYCSKNPEACKDYRDLLNPSNRDIFNLLRTGGPTGEFNMEWAHNMLAHRRRTPEQIEKERRHHLKASEYLFKSKTGASEKELEAFAKRYNLNPGLEIFWMPSK